MANVRSDSESVTRFDPGEHSELTPPSNDPTAPLQQQVPTIPTPPIMARAGPSPMHQIALEQGQGEKSTHCVLDQSYDCTADLFKASEDQGQAFFLDPFGMHQYTSAAHELHITEQSQLFTENPFGNRISYANYDLGTQHDRGLQFSQGSFINQVF